MHPHPNPAGGKTPLELALSTSPSAARAQAEQGYLAFPRTSDGLHSHRQAAGGCVAGTEGDGWQTGEAGFELLQRSCSHAESMYDEWKRAVSENGQPVCVAITPGDIYRSGLTGRPSISPRYPCGSSWKCGPSSSAHRNPYSSGW